MRIAIVGAGKIARDRHLPAIAAHPDFELAAVVDPTRPDLGVPCFATIAELRRDGPNIDAAALCTPPGVRAALVREARDAGWHLLLEKPPASTLGEAATMVALAVDGGTTVMATWHSRHAPKVAKARAWLATRTIRSGRVIWREDALRWHPGQHWLWQPGGFGVFDPAINAFSILTAITDAPWTVREAEFDVPDGLHAPIAARLTLHVRDAPVLADLHFNDDETPEWTILLDTDDGTLALRDGGASLAIGGEAERTAQPDEYGGIYCRFAELIEAGRSDVDCMPLQMVADAFLIARTRTVAPFHP